MKFYGIEFDNGVNNTHVKGYLRAPEQFNPSWHLGFRTYLVDKYKATNLTIYNINTRLTPDTMGHDLTGYHNMEDDFNLALRSNFYYPIDDVTDNIRRQWARLDPASPDFRMKER